MNCKACGHALNQYGICPICGWQDPSYGQQSSYNGQQIPYQQPYGGQQMYNQQPYNGQQMYNQQQSYNGQQMYSGQPYNGQQMYNDRNQTSNQGSDKRRFPYNNGTVYHVSYNGSFRDRASTTGGSRHKNRYDLYGWFRSGKPVSGSFHGY